ncbi:MAG: hypothetical protein JXB49_09045 [Bacteroidales bacterium]|nr:hypothetical protein [Bacteroidales bacterium]
MRTILKLTSLISGLIVLISCSRQIDCPDFDRDILDWFSYEAGDILTFRNEQNDSVLTLIVDEVLVEHTTDYDPNADCGTCDDHITIKNSLEGYSNFSIEAHLNKNQVKVEYYNINGNEFNKDNSSYSELSNYIFNGTSYGNVKVYQKADSFDAFVKLVIVKGNGLTGLVDRNGDIWMRVLIELGNNFSESIEIQNISCS